MAKKTTNATSKLDDELIQKQFLQIVRKVGSFSAAQKALGIVHKSTLTRYKNTHPDFKSACEDAKEYYDARQKIKYSLDTENQLVELTKKVLGLLLERVNNGGISDSALVALARILIELRAPVDNEEIVLTVGAAKSTPDQSLSSLSATMLREMLDAHNQGWNRLSVADLTRIHQALAQDRPVLELQLAGIGEQLEFMQRTVDSEDELKTINHFLERFQAHLEQESLSRVGTYKAGLQMQAAQDEDE